MATGRITAIILEVADLETSTRFYRDLVGLSLHTGTDNEATGDRWGTIRRRTRQPSRISRSTSRRATSPAARRWASAATTSVRRRFVPVIHPPRPEPWGQTSRYQDPDGNVVSLTQSRAKS